MSPRLLVVFALAAGATPGAIAGGEFELDFIGEQIIATGTRYAGTTVGGLSGIDYDRESGRYRVLTDARGARARIYTVAIDLHGDGIEAVRFEGVTGLSGLNGRPFGTPGNGGRPDPEALRWHAPSGRVFWASEGDGSESVNPGIHVADADGTTVRRIAAPAAFHRTGPGRGVRTNRSLESLALSADGNTLYTACESALLQDGEDAGVAEGAFVRVAAIDRLSGRALAEYAYRLEPVPHVPAGHAGKRENGLVELLALHDGRLLGLERAWVSGAGNFAALYVIDLDGATDVSTIPSLRDSAGWRPAAKKRVARLEDFETAIRAGRAGGAYASEPRLLDNLEGMTFGPAIDGAQTVVFVSDDNFGRFGPQFTQFLAFRLVVRD